MKKYNFEESLELLKEGNKRYSTNSMEHSGQNLKKMLEVINEQNPFAAILACSDSRVVPEFIFDRGIGDLFVIRNFGNTVSDHTLGSIEYAVETLRVPLIVVLGHTSCNAVKSAHKGIFCEGYLNTIIKEIEPVIDRNTEDKFAEEVSIRNNIENAVNKISTSEPVICKYIENEKIKVIGAVYDIINGEVLFLEN